MWTILFDIDGTLIRSGGAGLQAIEKVMRRRFGIVELPRVEVHGCTDRGIWGSLFSKLNLAFPANFEDLIDEYCELLEPALQQTGGEILPGVRGFLEGLNADNDIAIGLLTGNAERAARIKMKHFGLSDFVREFGGFVIGDTVRDIECARFVNAKAFAVATGGHSLSKLEAAGPDLIVKDFTKMEVPFHHYLSDRIQ